MDRIFPHFICTYIWLGEENNQTSDFILFIKELNAEIKVHIYRSFFSEAMDFTDYVFKHQAKFFRFLDPHVSKVKTIKTLLSRPWFTRVWTFQESALSKQYCIRLRHLGINRSELYNACWILNRILEVSAQVSDHYDEGLSSQLFLPHMCLRYNHSPEYIYHNQFEFRLAKLLQSRRKVKSRNPRDRLYTLLAICSDNNWHLFL